MDKKHIASVWYFLAAFLVLTALQGYVFAPHVECLISEIPEKEKTPAMPTGGGDMY